MATTWTPLNVMEALHRDIERALGNAGVSNEPFSRGAFLPGRAARRYPLINLYEDRDHVYVEALAPGIDVDSLALAVIGMSSVSLGRNGALRTPLPRRRFTGMSGRQGSLSAPSTYPLKSMRIRSRQRISMAS